MSRARSGEFRFGSPGNVARVNRAATGGALARTMGPVKGLLRGDVTRVSHAINFDKEIRQTRTVCGNQINLLRDNHPRRCGDATPQLGNRR